MDTVTGRMAGRQRDTGYQRQNFSVITNARTSTSEEMSGRIRRYTITMAFRTACFVAMIFVPGFWRWLLFAGAVFLPYIAVLLANQAHQRGMTGKIETPPAPDDAKQLTTGPQDVISGDVEDGPAGPEGAETSGDRREPPRGPDARFP